jgi:phage terminase large subunit GpA-like protein
MAVTATRATWLDGVRESLRPPPRLNLSDWADRYFYLSPESAAEPGRWRTLPYQKGILDSITDPAVERVTLMKSARVGYTKCIGAAIGYYMHQDPCPILVVQPTIEDAQGYSKEEIAPMLRDVDVLAKLVGESATRVSESTILAKSFPGGTLTMVGANSGRGFRRVSRRVVIFDEVDGYPPSAGAEGDQIQLGIRRTEYYWNRKIIAGSTPLVAGASRIEQMFEEGDRRRYHVACPRCAYRDVLVFREGERGHFLRWPEGKPEAAHFVCRGCGGAIHDHEKRELLESGEWIAEGDFRGHASFHIWAAYSLSPNASWPHLAAEFLEAKAQGPDKLRTFVNTALGETWHDRGEAPDWERLYLRREPYQIGSVPSGVRFLTAGVDVQKDRFVYEVVGWNEIKESWSIDAGVIAGDTSTPATWALLDELLGRTFHGADGSIHSIAMLAIDSGYNTQEVYNWARRYPMSRVIACKGVTTARTLIGVPSAVDVTTRGRRAARGYRVWPVGVSIAKAELYGWLRLPRPAEGEPAPPGYLHFPEHAEEFFKQLTAEHLATVHRRTGFSVMEWHVLPNRENHWLDARVLARAAASVQGIDRFVARGPAPIPTGPSSALTASVPAPSQRPAPSSSPAKRGGGSSWLGGGKGGGRPASSGGGSWLKGRRR